MVPKKKTQPFLVFFCHCEFLTCQCRTRSYGSTHKNNQNLSYNHQQNKYFQEHQSHWYYHPHLFTSTEEEEKEEKTISTSSSFKRKNGHVQNGTSDSQHVSQQSEKKHVAKGFSPFLLLCFLALLVSLYLLL